KPGARKAALGGVFSLAPCETLRTFGQAYSISIGPEVIGDQAAQPTALTNSPPSATSVPTERAPTVSLWIVALLLPAAMFYSRRVSAHLTARPVRRASSGAMNVYSPGPFLAPKPPPMYSQTTRTLSGGRPSFSATSARTPQMYCREV